MNSLQLQFFIVLLSENIKKPIKKTKNNPRLRQKKTMRQFKRKYNKNKQRQNRHIYTNKDMRM
jgi:hypothetical protein